MRPAFLHPLRALREADAAVRTQWAYIAEAAFEYFVSLTISGAYLTLLIKRLGASDALTGILSSTTIFACSLQVFAVGFVRRRRSVRATVLFMQTLQQLLYAGLFLLPMVPLAQRARTLLFAGMFLAGAVLSNLVAPAKFNWMMSFVAPVNRGVFTSHKEMVSLLTGLVYNYGMSRLVDGCAAAGHPDTGLRLCAVAIFVVMLFHVASLLAAKDAPQVLEEVRRTPSQAAAWRSLAANHSFCKLLVSCAGWNFLVYVSTPYDGVYILQELGGNATLIAVAGIVGSLARFFVSQPVGRLGDKHGFAASVQLGFAAAAVAFGLLVFWVPANGRVLYILYQLPYALAMAALSGGLLNIVFEYVPARDRVCAMGVVSAAGGLGGFGGSLAGGAILSCVQRAGDRVLGVPMYGQQLLHLVSFIGLVGLVLYQQLVVRRMARVEEKNVCGRINMALTLCRSGRPAAPAQTTRRRKNGGIF